MILLVVDDQQMFRESFVALLQIKLAHAIIHEASGGDEALEMVPKVRPDLVLLDVNMPDKNGLLVAEELLKTHRDTKVIAVTNVDGEAMVMHLVETGIHGFVLKNTGADELLQCIETVLKGKKYFCESVDKIMIRNLSRNRNLPHVHFTPRETAILQLMCNGKTSKEIAHILQLKEKTVNSYREELMQKTHTKNSTELVAFAFSNVLINNYQT